MDGSDFVIFGEVLVGYSGLFYNLRLRPLGWKVLSRCIHDSSSLSLLFLSSSWPTIFTV